MHTNKLSLTVFDFIKIIILFQSLPWKYTKLLLSVNIKPRELSLKGFLNLYIAHLLIYKQNTSVYHLESAFFYSKIF